MKGCVVYRARNFTHIFTLTRCFERLTSGYLTLGIAFFFDFKSLAGQVVKEGMLTVFPINPVVVSLHLIVINQG